MWLCTQHGFYSIVRKAAGEYHVRARLRRDLVNLREAARGEIPNAREWTIHRSVPADYRWRIVVGPLEVAAIFAALAADIDYDNFKGRIHARPDQRAKAAAYGNLWADLHALQAAVEGEGA